MSLFPLIAPGVGLPTFDLTNTANPAASTSNATEFTFSGASLGAAGASRIIIVTVNFVTNAVNRTIGSVTVGGNTCTSITTVYANPGDGFGSGIFAVQLEAGTTGDVVVTLSDALGANRALGVSVFRMVGRDSVSANATNTDTATSTGALTLSVNTLAAGGAVGCAQFFNNVTTTWAGLTEVRDTAFAGASYVIITSAFAETAGASSPLTITATPSGASVQATGAAASW
jgi:hypothetical protein